MTPDEVKKLNKADELAQSVLKLSRNTLPVNLRFPDMALSDALSDQIRYCKKEL